jgi:hypothetical protein
MTRLIGHIVASGSVLWPAKPRKPGSIRRYRSRAKDLWILSLLEEGLVPRIMQVDNFEAGMGNGIERRYIELFLELGATLFNKCGLSRIVREYGPGRGIARTYHGSQIDLM